MLYVMYRGTLLMNNHAFFQGEYHPISVFALSKIELICTFTFKFWMKKRLPEWMKKFSLLFLLILGRIDSYIRLYIWKYISYNFFKLHTWLIISHESPHEMYFYLYLIFRKTLLWKVNILYIVDIYGGESVIYCILGELIGF